MLIVCNHINDRKLIGLSKTAITEGHDFMMWNESHKSFLNMVDQINPDLVISNQSHEEALQYTNWKGKVFDFSKVGVGVQYGLVQSPDMDSAWKSKAAMVPVAGNDAFAQQFMSFNDERMKVANKFSNVLKIFGGNLPHPNNVGLLEYDEQRLKVISNCMFFIDVFDGNNYDCALLHVPCLSFEDPWLDPIPENAKKLADKKFRDKYTDEIYNYVRDNKRTYSDLLEQVLS